jgi:DNA-binding response OmpR family regulator
VHVLVADGSPVVRRLVATRLAADGFAVGQAADGEEALELMLRERPDVLVVAKLMSKIDSFALVRLLRADERTRTARVVMLSNYHADRVRAAALGVGVDAFMTKPFSPSAVSANVRALVER